MYIISSSKRSSEGLVIPTFKILQQNLRDLQYVWK